MANTKTMIGPSPETALTSYVMVERRADGYLLDDDNGTFTNTPVDPHVPATEDATRKGMYQLDESRTVWNNGEYVFTFYKQTGGSPAPVSDTIIGTGELWILSDAEVVVDDPANFKADVSNLDVAVSTRLATAGYTAPDNATLTLVSKWIQNRLVVADNGDGTKTVILYGDDSATPLKTWTHTTATGVRTKAT